VNDALAERIWRLRRRQHHIDALLRQYDEGGFTLTFTMNGRQLAARRCASRTQAKRVATEKRKELERAGWAIHW
jgi:hypothetical protein